MPEREQEHEHTTWDDTGERNEERQNALVHDGASPDPIDDNETADRIADVRDPDGKPVKRAD